MVKKYLVVGGYIYSKDGDKHYISTPVLMQLYKVNPEECLVTNEGEERSYLLHNPRRRNLTILRPRADGNYILRR